MTELAWLQILYCVRVRVFLEAVLKFNNYNVIASYRTGILNDCRQRKSQTTITTTTTTTTTRNVYSAKSGWPIVGSGQSSRLVLVLLRSPAQVATATTTTTKTVRADTLQRRGLFVHAGAGFALREVREIA
ncbi:unnamed protein product [Polarella glacialis]|uniref:Uncharacterized protein n=1 Tax=Polarella glacialis TaxID=89957 RepID=A0A813G573_POLGL|nr:unnamed protein product [Polarella glacialis]